MCSKEIFMKEDQSSQSRSILNMMCLDVFLSSLEKKELDNIDLSEELKIRKIEPLMSWDIISLEFKKSVDQIKIDAEMDQLILHGQKYEWEVDLQLILAKPYEALVLTDKWQKIQWTNRGFYEMTGYSSSFAKGKNPKFLQGKNTSKETGARIRDHIQAGRPFKEVVINYKKDAREYYCELQVFPIKNKSQTITHFLALEREV